MNILKKKLIWKRLGLAIGCFGTVTLVTIPTITSCSHVYSDQTFFQGLTTIEPSKTFIEKNVALDPGKTEPEIINDIWLNIDSYKNEIAKSGAFGETILTNKDITIPYSSIMIKKDSWYTMVTMQAYLRTYNFNGSLINLLDTAFPQHGDYDINTYKIQVETNIVQEITKNLSNHDYLSQWIVNYQIANRLFDSIPSRVNSRDVQIITAELNKDTGHIEITFNLKCIYNKNGLNQEKFTLDISQDNDGLGLYSLARPQLTTTAIKQAISSNGDVSNSRYWITESECSAAITFNFKS